MDNLLILAVLILVGLPIVLLILFFRLNHQVGLLSDEVSRLQLRLSAYTPGEFTKTNYSGGDASADFVETAEGAAAPSASISGDSAEPEATEDQPSMTPPPIPASSGDPEAVFEVAASTAEKSLDLESLIGGRWSVLLGGFAVALGALFLVRYSIEAGLLGPAARVAGGVILAGGLLAGGEWLRRKDGNSGLPAMTSADIPGVLTGAGVIAAFGTAYAAHSLYGFIGPAIAFVLLTGIGLASLLLAAVHGPKLAAVGLLGAFAAPALTNASEPNQLALALHVLVVTASVLSVARIRAWRWLAMGGVVGSLLWTIAIILFFNDDAHIATLLQTVGLAVIFAVGFGWQSNETNGSFSATIADEPADRLAYSSFVSLTVLAVPFVLGLDNPLNVILVLLVGSVLVGAGNLAPALTKIAPWAALLTTALAAGMQMGIAFEPAIVDDRLYTGLPVPPDMAAYVTSWLIGSLPVAALALWGSWRAAGEAPKGAGYRAISFALISVLGLCAIYMRVSFWQVSWSTAFAAILLAAICVGLTETFTRRREGDFAAPAPAVYAVAAIAFLALAMGVVSTKLWLPFGMALTSLGVAWVYRDRPFPALPKVAVILAVSAFAGLYFNAPFASDAIGTTPFFNKLVLITGLPALALIAAGEILRKSQAGRWADLQTAIGLALLALFVALELRHFISGGNIASSSFGLADMAAQSIAALGFAIGLQFSAQRSGAAVFNTASLVAGAVGIFMLFAGLALGFNPLLTDDAVGQGRVFNQLLPGYLLTGLMAGLVTLLSAGVRPRWYRLGYGAMAGLLLFFYASLMVRHGFQGERLGFWRNGTDNEVWTYSVVWLILGGLLLAAGLFSRSLPLRIASAGVILLTVAKVFLIDMSALTGALRAFSFIGLGLVLILIGRFYQRILAGGKIGGGEQPPSVPAVDGPPDAS